MAFVLQNWGRVSVTMNAPLVTLESGAIQGAPAAYSYQSSTDAQATIAASGYFNEVYYDLSIGDLIYVVGSDGNAWYSVTTLTSHVVVISAFSLAGPVGTANISNLAVTTAKLADASVTSAKVDPLLEQYATGTFLAAAFQGAYATPVSILAAPGAGKAIIVKRFVLEYVYVSAAYANGGNIYLEYGSTAHGALLASANIAPAGFTDQAASTSSAASGAVTGVATASMANAAISLTNATAAFITGDGTFKWHMWYSVVSV